MTGSRAPRARREALLAELRGHDPHDAKEATDLVRMAGHLLSAHDPFDRHDAGGHFTASALVAAPALDRVLLIHHRALDRWLQCGGHMEPEDPTPAAAALREAHEETGLADVALHPAHPRLLDLDVHTIPERGDMPAHDHLDLRYLVVADPDAALLPAEAEAKDLRWFSLEEARTLDPDPALLRLFAKAQALARLQTA